MLVDGNVLGESKKNKLWYRRKNRELLERGFGVGKRERDVGYELKDWF